MERLPEWVKEIRPHQKQAVADVIQTYDEGVDVVILDAPTGSGKTLIGELVRREMGTRGLYVCSDKGLQDQVCRDFPYAKLIKGRANYATELAPFPEITAADCEGEECGWCEGKASCPYDMAKRDALMGELAVANTAYFLYEANYAGEHAGSFSGQEFVVVDECDLLENALMGVVEFRVGGRMMRELGLSVPGKGTHKTTIRDWLANELIEGITQRSASLRGKKLEVRRERVRLSRLKAAAWRVVRDLQEDEHNWVRDNDAGPLVLKPVHMGPWGQRMVWRHGEKWLLMSATVVSGEMMAWGTGMREGTWRVVSVPMTFPRENRPIRIAPVADMSKKGQQNGSVGVMEEAVKRVCKMYPNDRVLVHTVSYKLAHGITSYLVNSSPRMGREVFTYATADGKGPALEDWQASENGIMVAPSLDRGVDLKGDDCRVVVVAKVPFPNLGDVQVSTMLHTRHGQMWYDVETVRGLVQMSGRAVRSEDDYADTWVLDSCFVGNVWKKNKGLFPGWWREAVDTRVDVRQLTRDHDVR